MRRRALFVAIALTAWAAGSGLGSLSAPVPARADVGGIVLGRAHVRSTPDLSGRKTITILAVGSDARPGEIPQYMRADSLHVIFLHPRKEQAVIVGIPRDSWVPIAGAGTDKINAAMGTGGPERLVRTIEQDFGQRIDFVPGPTGSRADRSDRPG